MTNQEKNYDCGAACLSMIIKYYNGYINIEDLREITKTTVSGTSFYNIIVASKQIGLDAVAYKLNYDELLNKKLIYPLIASLNIENKYYHYVVIYKITNKKIIIGDPAVKGIQKLSQEQFKKIFNKAVIMLYPNKKLPDNRKEKSIYKYTYKIIKNNKELKNHIFKIILYSNIIATLEIFISFYFYIAITILEKNLTHQLYLITLLFILSIIIKNILSSKQSNQTLNFDKKLDSILTEDGYFNILTLPYNYMSNHTSGELLSKLLNIKKIKNGITSIVLTFTNDFLIILLSSIVLIKLNLKLFILELFFLLIYTIIIKKFKTKEKIQSSLVQENSAYINSYIIESINSYETIKGLNLSTNFINKFNTNYQSYLEENKKLNKLYIKESILKNIVLNINSVIINFIGIILIIKKTFTLAVLITFNLILNYFLEPIQNILNTTHEIREGAVALQKIKSLNIKSEKVDISRIEKIDIKNLNFKYKNKENIKNLKLSIKSKDIIAVVGKSGSGKSTIAKIIKGYYNSNKILINDKQQLKGSKSKVVYISQLETLYTDTLENNIKLNRDLDEVKILSALSLTYVDELMRKNQLNMQSFIEDCGSNLSGGEKQRIILARSLLNEFDVLIIDEGLNQVDIDLERKILKNIIKEYKNKIIIFITHRIDNIDLFNRIVKIEDGHIVENIERSNQCLEYS